MEFANGVVTWSELFELQNFAWKHGFYTNTIHPEKTGFPLTPVPTTTPRPSKIDLTNSDSESEDDTAFLESSKTQKPGHCQWTKDYITIVKPGKPVPGDKRVTQEPNIPGPSHGSNYSPDPIPRTAEIQPNSPEAETTQALEAILNGKLPAYLDDIIYFPNSGHNQRLPRVHLGMTLPPYHFSRRIQEEKREKQLKALMSRFHTKVSLNGPNAERLLEKINELHPDMTELTLKDIAGKTANIIQKIDPRGIYKLSIENRSSAQLGDQLNILLRHFKEVKHLRLYNCGSPLGDLEDGKYFSLKIRDLVYGSKN